MNITELNPKNVWGYFAQICAIPHPSKHEEAILDFLKDFAREHNLSYRQDAIGNIVIEKPASAGYEDKEGVILQAHVDMVPQKNSDTDFDFTKDAIRPLIDGEWVTADGTTLGADNGIGGAAMLAVLSDNTLCHPRIEALFTVDEETGLTGANALSDDMLTGKTLLNLDSEDEGELYVGCAGAVNNTVTMKYDSEDIFAGYTTYELSLRGLKGGHSGMEIILQRGNANKLMTRFIREQISENRIRLVEFDGGGLRNAIPREAKAVVIVPSERLEKFAEAVTAFEATLQREYGLVEGGAKFTLAQTNAAHTALTPEHQKAIIAALTATPNGIFRMSDAVEGLVETSTNMSRVELKDGELCILFMTRCMVNYGKKELNAMIRSVWELAGATVKEEGDYDGWAPNMESNVLAKMQNLYQELYGKTPEVKAIHAGLECGIIGAKYEGLDMISFGPTIRYPHSPDEKVKIDTVEKFYDFLTKSLAAL
ncbi:MAG: aminoacyl-histidine dipeptidase [Rikenellaceae bacterium]